MYGYCSVYEDTLYIFNAITVICGHYYCVGYGFLTGSMCPQLCTDMVIWVVFFLNTNRPKTLLAIQTVWKCDGTRKYAATTNTH